MDGRDDLGVCSTPIVRAAMVHWWDELTFLHWRFAVEDVQRLLPRGLEVEPFDGAARVGWPHPLGDQR
jgi:uncharacterized protein YqjF (DUF2071 family)